MIEIGISVKAAPWRMEDSASRVADMRFQTEKVSLFADIADQNGFVSCEGCGAATRIAINDRDTGLTRQGYFEVHHKSGDHADNSRKNLAILCPFCHAPFHIGFNCAAENGCLVYAPEIAQADISRIAFVATTFYHVTDNQYVTSLKQHYGRLSARRTLVDDVIGADAGVNVAREILSILRDRRPGSNERRAALPRLLSPIRYLPYIEESNIGKASAYWRRIYRGIQPDEQALKGWWDRIRAADRGGGSGGLVRS